MELDLDPRNGDLKSEISQIQEVVMEDQINGLITFLSGVVEGFYGHPWTLPQRKHLITNMRSNNLNSYLYAPKDDRKHRFEWRVLYDPMECDMFKSLVQCCVENDVNFIYSLSPGNDIVCSSQTDRDLLVKKFQQLAGLGVTSFGLLFDDIDVQMDDSDSQIYDNIGRAHSDIANFVFETLNCPKHFLFCPVEYCTSRAMPTLLDSKYLNIVGQSLRSEIMILWTGPRVISRVVPIDHIRNISRVLKRPPIIWDNLHANDYDEHSIFMGPYKDRQLELCHITSGVFLNPNCQYEINYIPIKSFGMWLGAASKTTCLKNDPSKSYSNVSLSLDFGDYDPNRVFKDCCRLWAEDLRSSNSSLQSDPDNSTVGSRSSLEASNISESTLSKPLNESSNYGPKIDEKPPTYVDIYRIASFFYLPGQFGPLVTDLYRTFECTVNSSCNVWQKKVNNHFVHNSSNEVRKNTFKRSIEKILSSIKVFMRCESLAFHKIIVPFVSEIKDSIHLMRSYLKYLETKESDSEESLSETYSLINRSRFYNEIQKLIPSFAFNSILTEPCSDSSVYLIRPPHDYDLVFYNLIQERLETICYGHLISRFGYWDDLRPSKQLSNLRTNYKILVAEDPNNLCGYMLYKQESDLALEENLQLEYNSYVVNNSLTDHYYLNFIQYPEIVPSILKAYPMKLLFCFQAGFKKSRIFEKLLEFVKRTMVQNKIKGAHILVDKFELIETSLLKSCGFFVPPDGSLSTHKYYVLENIT